MADMSKNQEGPQFLRNSSNSKSEKDKKGSRDFPGTTKPDVAVPKARSEPVPTGGAQDPLIAVPGTAPQNPQLSFRCATGILLSRVAVWTKPVFHPLPNIPRQIQNALRRRSR